MNIATADFSSITSVNNYVKLLSLKNISNQNANNSESVIPGNPNSFSQGGDDRLSSIVMKMQSGEELSTDDMEYLRVNHPEVYEEAVRLSKEKREYEESLSRCNTKDEARALHMGKVAEALSRAKAAMAVNDVAACVAAGAKLAAMSRVFSKFTVSREYANMAENYSEINESLEALREELEGARKQGENNTEAADEVQVKDAPEDDSPNGASGENNFEAQAVNDGHAHSHDGIKGENAETHQRKPSHSPMSKGLSGSVKLEYFTNDSAAEKPVKINSFTEKYGQSLDAERKKSPGISVLA